MKLFRQLKKKICLKLRYIIFIFKWRIKNQRNKTIPKNIFPEEIVTVGKYTYGELNVRYWDSKGEKLIIGNFVSIAEGVKFILGGNHEIETFTTYPFKVMSLGEKVEAWTKGPIIVEDDVWLGMDSLILSGVRIGQGAIIAAGSVVTKDVAPYSIVGGNPAKILKYRYSEEIIKEMINFDWSKVNLSKINKLKKDLYEPLTFELVKKIKKEFE